MEKFVIGLLRILGMRRANQRLVMKTVVKNNEGTLIAKGKTYEAQALPIQMGTVF